LTLILGSSNHRISKNLSANDAIHMLEMLDNSDIDFCSDDSDDDGDFEPTCSDTQSADSDDYEEF